MLERMVNRQAGPCMCTHTHMHACTYTAGIQLHTDTLNLFWHLWFLLLQSSYYSKSDPQFTLDGTQSGNKKQSEEGDRQSRGRVLK